LKKACLLLAVTALSACAVAPRTPDAYRYDFGPAVAGETTWRLPLASIEVQSASWLATGAMHYRLSYAEPLRRQSYSESRWAAPPPNCWRVCSGATMLRREEMQRARVVVYSWYSMNWSSVLTVHKAVSCGSSCRRSCCRLTVAICWRDARCDWKGRRPARMLAVAQTLPVRRFWRWPTKSPHGPMISRATGPPSSRVAETETTRKGPSA
jgi:hypothetical protein